MNNIKSMTGFGKGVIEADGKRITVEIRSLNSKQLDLSVKMPPQYRETEFEIRSLASKSLNRGKIDIFVNSESIGSRRCTQINKEVVNEYYRQLQQTDINASNADYLQTIMRLPEVINQDKAEVNKQEIDALYAAIGMALESINNHRLNEGDVMITDMLKRISKIENLKNELLSYEPERMQTVRTRLRDNLESLKVNVDENRFEQELIYYLEKLDITEEKVRLQNHLDYFREVCKNEEEVGRKIGFISQEIGREINTTGSKSNHAEMQKIVVRMKDELEKIKEQALNIL